MKSDWIIRQLSEIVDFNPRESLLKGTTAKKISMGMLQPYCRDVPTYELTTFMGGTKFRNGDTLMARITPCLENGKIAQVNILGKDEVAFGSTEYIVFRAKDGIADPDYIYYLVCSPVVREPAIKSMVGSSGRQRVQTDVVQKLEVKIPPLPEQRKIAVILKAMDDKIEVNTKINKNLEEQAQAIYSAMFSIPVKNWKNCVLSDIATITMGQSPKGSSYNEEGIGTIFYQGRAEFGFRFPTQRLFTTEPKRMAKENDVLMSVRAPVGDLNIASTDCCIGRGLGAIHSKDEHQSFILYTLLSLRKQLDVFNGEGTVFGSINRDTLNSISLSLPPINLINQFESIASPMDNQIRNNYEESIRLSSIRDNLLSRLMRGELDVSNLDL
jgi:type I restriction enzyme S subunit